MVIGGAKASWRPVTSGVPYGLILGLILFNLFINDRDNRAEHTLSKFANDINLGGVADMPDHHAVIQQNLNRLEKWTERSPLEVQQREVQRPAPGEK